MYSKQEASLLNQQFWTALGQYLSPVVNADGEKINWINYKTGEKNIRFTMKMDNKIATIAIELSHQDQALREKCFEKFLQLKKILETHLGEKWQWQQNTFDENGKQVSLIYAMLHDVNIYDKADWPSIISFFKNRIIAMDQFWCENKFAFE